MSLTVSNPAIATQTLDSRRLEANKLYAPPVCMYAQPNLSSLRKSRSTFPCIQARLLQRFETSYRCTTARELSQHIN